MKEFQGRVAVITGAASGLGREFANTAAARGMKLVLADVQVEALEKATDELLEQGAQVLAMVCDVRKAAHVQELADAALARFGGVHLVFNNAGVAMGGLVWEHTEADWEWVLGVNLWGPIHGVRVFVHLMLECAARDPLYEGHIVNTASMAGLVSTPALGIYNVSKHAVVALTETLHHDLKLAGAPIGVSLLCPQSMHTGIYKSNRNRPEELKSEPATPSQVAAQALAEKDVATSGVSAADVAQLTFEAIREGRFYVYPQPDGLGAVAQRMEAIVRGKAPADPYVAAPHLREMLRAKL